MTLRRKTLLLMSITLAGLILLLYLVLRIIMLGSFSTLERQVTLRNLDRATNSLNDSIDSLSHGIIDWSNWDDTYQFAQNGNADFIRVNVTDDTLSGLKINVMMFVNAVNQIIFTKAVDLDPALQTKLVQDLESYTRTDERFLRLTTASATAGFIVIDGEPMLIASHPILPSDGSGPKSGTLIWIRDLDAQQLTTVSESLRLSVDLRSVNAPDLPNDFHTMQDALTPSSNQDVAPLDDTTIAGYRLLNDIYQQPALILKTSQEREIYWQGQISLTYFVVALVIVGIVGGAAMLVLLERSILSPVAKLSDGVRFIGVNDDFSMRLPIAGHDELAQLAAALNTMLNTVSQSRAALQRLNSDLESRVGARTLELEHQKSQLQAIMETMGEGLIYCVDGLITYVNGAFVELLDYQAADLVGKPFALLNTQLDPTDTPVFFKTPRRYETILTRRDGSPIHVAITSTPVDEADDRARRVIIVRDITQELANKAQKDQFFARASHDLRAPLTSILTRLYLLGKKPDELERHLKILNHVANHMLELVNDLLNVTRIEQGVTILNQRDLVLQSVVDEVVEVQQADAEQKQIQLCANLVDTPLHVFGDPLRLNQVITNLVSNAIHYTQDGGQITVKVEMDESPDVQYAVIQVSDNGIGISPENLTHIFDPFFRVSKENSDGSGLGLYIVKEIVELHGGKVKVSSELGVGTTFSVCLALKSIETEPQAVG